MVPEAFRLREDILALPAKQRKKVVQSCLDTVKIILNKKPKEFEITEPAAELEQSDIEAVMLPLVLPWAQENLERGERTWPAVKKVECFIEILQELNTKQSKALPTNLQPCFEN